jgi:Ca2+-binding EF-hand superfamily protein
LLIDGYFNSKHVKITQELYDEFFKKIDLNQDGKINFNDYDVFIRIVYETEYLPALEKEIARRENKDKSKAVP